MPSSASKTKSASRQSTEGSDPASLIADNLNIWTSAIKRKSSVGRGQGKGSNKKIDLYGIKKLRELILELAVRGLLVPQDPNDEPASELLKKIVAEKAKLIKENKIKKQKSLPPVSEEENTFDLPTGWEVERVGNIVSRLGSGSTPRGGKNAYTEDGVPFLRSQNVRNDGLKLDDIAYIPAATHEKMDNTKVFPGDVLLNITGASLGRSTIFPEEIIEANVSQHVTIIRLLSPEMARFVHLGILSPMIQKLVWGRQVGMAIEGLSKKVLEVFEFPIPPLAEQHRIVAKVDELMALCDQLEQQTDASISAHQTLVETLLAALTATEPQITRIAHGAGSAANADNAGAIASAQTGNDRFQQAWQRIAQHFDTLFTTEHSIDQLKQTILQLAVMGKLVPQNPSDEPASELLKKVATEKAKLIKEKKIRKQKPLPSISVEEKSFKLPARWEQAQFGDVLFNRDAERIPLSVDERKTRRGEFDYYGASGVIDSIDDYLFDKPLLLIGEDGANLINRSTLIAFMAYGKYWVNNHAHVLDGLTQGLLDYVSLHINAISLELYVTGTAQPKMNQAKMNSIVLRIPPEDEQHRIVNKVDELLALCDELKSRLSDTQTTQLHLADAVVGQAGA